MAIIILLQELFISAKKFKDYKLFSDFQNTIYLQKKQKVLEVANDDTDY